MTDCPAVLNIAGEHFCCDNPTVPHPGWAHQNQQAQALWCDDKDLGLGGTPPQPMSRPEDDEELKAGQRWRVERLYDFTSYQQALDFWRASDTLACLYVVNESELDDVTHGNQEV